MKIQNTNIYQAKPNFQAKFTPNFYFESMITLAKKRNCFLDLGYALHKLDNIHAGVELKLKASGIINLSNGNLIKREDCKDIISIIRTLANPESKLSKEFFDTTKINEVQKEARKLLEYA